MSFWISSFRSQLSKGLKHMLQLSSSALQTEILNNSICGARTSLSFLQIVHDKSYHVAYFKKFVLD